MGWLRSKTTAIAGGCFVLIALAGYGLISMRNAVENKIVSVEQDFPAAPVQDESKSSQQASSLDDQANGLAEKLKQENTQTAQRFRREPAAKAAATTRLAEVQQNATAKSGTASGEQQVVRTDLDATRPDPANTKKELTGPASETSPSKTVLASVSAVGAVEVRGIPIRQDATIFSGDRLRVGDKGYAKLSFPAGHKIELTEKTDITVTNTRNSIEVALSSGTAGFATAANGGSVTVRVGNVEVIANETAAGHIAVLGAESVGVRVVNGGVLVRDIKTKESWTVAAGQERLFSGGTSKPAEPLPQLASNIPPQMPTVPPSPPQQGNSTQSSSRWRRAVAWLFGEAVGAAVLLPADPARSASLTPGTERVGSAIAIAQQAQTVAVRLIGVGDQVQAAVAAAQNVLPPTRTDLMSRARTVVTQAQTSQQHVESLLAQLKQLQDSLAAGNQRAPGPLVSNDVAADEASIESQIDAIIVSLNAEIAVLNQLIVQLNNVVVTATNAGVANVPNVDLQTVPMAPTPSRSQP